MLGVLRSGLSLASISDSSTTAYDKKDHLRIHGYGQIAYASPCNRPALSSSSLADDVPVALRKNASVASLETLGADESGTRLEENGNGVSRDWGGSGGCSVRSGLPDMIDGQEVKSEPVTEFTGSSRSARADARTLALPHTVHGDAKPCNTAATASE